MLGTVIQLFIPDSDAEDIEEVGDLCDQLYDHDNDINHLLELEVIRMEQEKNKRSNLQTFSIL